MKTLEFKNIKATIATVPILLGVNLTLELDKIHALMGPNGSGKSTLSHVTFGNGIYESSGQILLDGEDIMDLGPEERAQRGLFLAFQYPVEISGITVGRFLKRVNDTLYRDDKEMKKNFVRRLREATSFMQMDQSFINRYLNEGFSGGEKKRMEILQMLVLRPRFAILDETDSGLDVDALKVVAKGVKHLYDQGNFGALIITHYQRILNHIHPDHVHIMFQGRIVKSGGVDIVEKVEEGGYQWISQEALKGGSRGR